MIDNTEVQIDSTFLTHNHSIYYIGVIPVPVKGMGRKNAKREEGGGEGERAVDTPLYGNDIHNVRRRRERY